MKQILDLKPYFMPEDADNVMETQHTLRIKVKKLEKKECTT